jgi:hypothetical protein
LDREARNLLAPIYRRYTEGFDTPDLKPAIVEDGTDFIPDAFRRPRVLEHTRNGLPEERVAGKAVNFGSILIGANLSRGGRRIDLDDVTRCPRLSIDLFRDDLSIWEILL